MAKRIKNRFWLIQQIKVLIDFIHIQARNRKVGTGVTTLGDEPCVHIDLWYFPDDSVRPRRRIDEDDGVRCIADLTPQEERVLDDLIHEAVQQLPGFTYTTTGKTINGWRSYSLIPPDSACIDVDVT